MTSPTRRVLMASLVGSAIEWFDFFLYGSATAIVFNRLFFPSADPLVSLLLSYLSFALPFFIRPIGGIVFAHIGDRVGRKKTLVMTLALMGGGTTLIGILPTYASIGLGGEWGGAVLLAYEYGPPGRKGFFGSIPQSGVTLGMLLSALTLGLASLLPDGEFISWGWRVPFVLSAGLVLIGLWIRNGIDETPEFKILQITGRSLPDRRSVARLSAGGSNSDPREVWRNMFLLYIRSLFRELCHQQSRLRARNRVDRRCSWRSGSDGHDSPVRLVV
jgi:MFS family permease